MKRILIANRGEIACRIIRAAKTLGIETVAVHSDADAQAAHVQSADIAIRVGPPPASASYLDLEAILNAARSSGADAIHPGYGFLAENAAFARQVRDQGLIWIGPDPESIDAMGDKGRARALAREAGVPILQGSRRFEVGQLDGLEEAAEATGFPLLVKASAGGGGIGMRRVDRLDQLAKIVEATQGMAARSFGDGTIYLERYIPRARHVEIQIFGHGDGRAHHLFERDCSTQRRFQKIIEESPAPGLDPQVVATMAEAARRLAASQNYCGAGTIEFIVDAETQEFFFLEMNTRIQVEHPVTELVCGVDLVGMQIRFARGEDVSPELDGLKKTGHAIECRLYAENPAKMFLPQPGTLSRFDLPAERNGIRIDTGVRAGDTITQFYDPMIAKIIAHGADRPAAIQKAVAALKAIHIEGLVTNRDFLIAALLDPDFASGKVWTGFVEERRQRLVA
jgi:3-methylcrotonyl-CoA carboxylase alpha subunit